MVVRKNPEQLLLRLPEGMKDRLREEAKSKDRSLSAEIVARLESQIEQEEDESFRIWLPKPLLDRILHQAEEQEVHPNELISGALADAFPDRSSLMESLIQTHNRLTKELDRVNLPNRETVVASIEAIELLMDEEREKERAKAGKPNPWKRGQE